MTFFPTSSSTPAPTTARRDGALEPEGATSGESSPGWPAHPPRLGQFGRRGLLATAVLLTLVVLAVAGAQLRHDADALNADLQRQLLARALSITPVMEQARTIGDGVAMRLSGTRTVPGGIQGLPANDAVRCDERLTADPVALAAHLILATPDHRPPSGPTACLLSLLESVSLLASGTPISSVTVIGADWALTYPDMPRGLRDNMTGERLIASIRGLSERALKTGQGMMSAPYRSMVAGRGITAAYLTRSSDRPDFLAVTVSLSLDGLWREMDALPGLPDNELLIVDAKGTVVLRGGAPSDAALPDARTGDRPSLPPADVRRALAGAGQPVRDGGWLTAALPLTNLGWSLVVRVPWPEFLSWLLWGAVWPLAGATLLLAGIWLAYGAASRRLLAPAILLEQRLHQAVGELRLTFDNMTEGLCLLDREGRVKAANAHLAVVLDLPEHLTRPGATLAEVNTHLAGLYPPGMRLLTMPTLLARLADGGGQYSFDAPLPGARRWYEARFRLVPGGDMIVGLATDITARKRDELALVAAKERAVKALTQLEEAQGQLVESEKMAALGGLVAGVAHEVNTPIGVGVTAASTLAERTRLLAGAFAERTMTKEMLDDYLDRAATLTSLIQENLDRATRLVRSFKQVAIDQNGDAEHDVRLKQYLEDALVNLRPELKRGRHTLAIEGDGEIIVRAVPAQLWQVASNLVLNAIIHAFPDQEGGTVRITLTRSGPRAILEVRDDGIGMTEEVRHRCFEPFYTTKRGRGGSGLGLSITHTLVTNGLNGRITVDSALGAGTTFRIEMPLVLPSVTATGTGPEALTRTSP
ncbi:sensor histidine kinase [Nitrospirillum sp. BR 11163]|uniref:sensor histidine kinase n=1 Tax=Nitrospirillum sp. BR 11163 TaxID=3104323 RepID=UPI002AFF7F0F|nr:ATP-binding protein [Nitrospirillum sp. BR 11163]MEA1672603.1 ATP-binding protein [Nitrospirillum sp. BR 11163]